MNTALSDAIKEAYTLAPPDKIVLDTLEVRQIGVQASIYVVRAASELTAFDENGIERIFEPAGFQLTLPPSNEEGFQSLTITIDNIDRRVSDFIELAKSEKVPVEVVYRPYLSDDLSTPQMIPPLVLFLKDIQITSHQVSARATFMDVVNKKFPTELYSRLRFPALG